MKHTYIGYWNNEKNTYPEYIIPKNEIKYDNSKEIEMLKVIFDNSQKMFCKGSSTCRCCGQMNGSVEYKYQNKNNVYIIPEGYLHYIKDHYIKLDEKIYEIHELLIKRRKV